MRGSILVAIIPPGNYADQFPRAVPDSAAHLASQEISKEINALNASIAKSRSVVSNLIAKYSKFFTAHFGMQVEKKIIQTYFTTPVAQGAGTNAITEQIFQFTSPTITEYGGSRDVISAVVLGISQLQVLPAQVAQKLSNNLSTIEDAVFDMTYRPDFAAMKALGEKSSTYLSRKVQESLNNPNRTIFNPGFFKGITNSYEKFHPDGYEIKVDKIIGFYDTAIATGVPANFWDHLARYRLTVIDEYYRNAVSRRDVHLVQVDPATGAPKTIKGTVVASIWLGTNPSDTKQALFDNPNLLVSKVRKNLFPELYLLKEGMTISADSRQELYKKQLENAAMLWRGIPDKNAMPMAIVLTEQFQAESYATKPGQGTTGSARTMKIYLQPPGTEAAMRRLLDGRDPSQRAQKLYGSFLGGQGQESDKDGYMYKIDKEATSASAENLAKNQARFENCAAITLNLLSNPKTYSDGKPFLDDIYNVSRNPNTNPILTKFYVQNLQLKPLREVNDYSFFQAGADFVSNLYYSQWPTAKPTLIFEAPIDDEADLKMLINMFKNYMLKEAGSHPETLKIPEPMNVRIKKTEDISNVYIGFDVGMATSSYKPPKSYAMYSYFPLSATIPIETNSHPGSTTKYQHYYINAKGLISGQEKGTVSVERLPMQIAASGQQATSASSTRGALSHLQGTDTALMVGGTGLLLGLVVYGAHVWRNQSS